MAKVVDQEFFKNSVRIESDELCRLLAAGTMQMCFNKGSVVVREGEPVDCLYFLEHGVLRSFISDADGAQTIDRIIALPGEPALPRMEAGGSSPETLEALTTCKLAALRVSLVNELIERYPEAGKVFDYLLRKTWRAHQRIGAATRNSSAQDRYLWFLDAYPQAIDQIPHRHIAELLGITPVTLSRVRSNLGHTS